MSDQTTAGVSVRANVASRGVELDVELHEGMCTAILGPNGAGKSTLLHLISGLVQPSSGSVHIGSDAVAGNGRFIPAHERDIGLLAQDPLLFPHLSVIENIEFGPRSRGASRDDARALAREKLAKLGCADLADSPANEISGGQAQRIGLARALATNPEVLLLDEPLAALDAVTAPQMREVLRENLHGRTTALVTHDLLDVLVLAQRVVVLNRGRVVVAGLTTEVFAQPRDEFLAQFLGVNVVAGRGTETGLALGGGVHLHGIRQGEPHDDPNWASFPATAVTLHHEHPGGSARNLLSGVVTAIEPRGALARIICDVAGNRVAADITSQSVVKLGIAVGGPILLGIKAAAVAIY